MKTRCLRSSDGSPVTHRKRFLSTGITYGEFFRGAPHMNPDRMLIKGTVCGVRVENIAEPLMREIRYLDKLVDELAKGKGMDTILRKSFTDR